MAARVETRLLGARKRNGQARLNVPSSFFYVSRNERPGRPLSSDFWGGVVRATTSCLILCELRALDLYLDVDPGRQLDALQ